MRALVNGEEWDLTEGDTVADVLARLGAPTTGVAVACGGAVVPKGAWPVTPVRDGDEIEVLTAVQGG